MKQVPIVILSAAIGAALVLAVTKYAPDTSVIVRLWTPPTATLTTLPTHTPTETPTETPTITPTETPDPDPWKSSCAVYGIAARRLEDALEETSASDPHKLGYQYGLAQALSIVAGNASDRGCYNYDWTAIRRQFERLANDLDDRATALERLYQMNQDAIRNGLSNDWSVESESSCMFNIRGESMVLSTVIKAEGAPDERLLNVVGDWLGQHLWRPIQKIVCPKSVLEKGGGNTKPQRRNQAKH